MRILLTMAGVGVALVFIAVSAAMNVTFVASLGRTAFESQLFGAVSLACDAAKALLPIVCAHALRNDQRLRAAIGIIMFALFTATSFLSAVGFTAVNRMTVAKSAEDRVAQRAAITKEIVAIEMRIANLPVHRPAAIIVEAMASTQLDRRWTLSKQCTDVTDARSRVHCEGYFALRAEHAAALEADKLEARRATLGGQLKAGDQSPADADAQAGVVATALDLERGTIQRVLILLVALIVELGSGLGLYLAWQPAVLKQSHRETPDAASTAASTVTHPDRPRILVVEPCGASASPVASLPASVDLPGSLSDAPPLEPLTLNSLASSEPMPQLPLASPSSAEALPGDDPLSSRGHSGMRDPEILRAVLRRPGPHA